MRDYKDYLHVHCSFPLTESSDISYLLMLGRLGLVKGSIFLLSYKLYTHEYKE